MSLVFHFSLAGCKIKALRAKTNTYIKTPVRGEQPVFVVTGRKEDVAMAKREILSAAEHFSLIRASRNKAGPLSAATGPGNPSLPGQTTIQVSRRTGGDSEAEPRRTLVIFSSVVSPESSRCGYHTGWLGWSWVLKVNTFKRVFY